MNQKAVIYCRVSAPKQVKEGHGLESQETRCQEYAASRGYSVEAVFKDDITGGGDFMKRPGMMKLLRFLDAHPKEQFVVIFDDLKRYARDTLFHLKLRQEMAVRNATRECLNFKFEDSPEGEFVETVIAAQSQLERQQNSRQVAQKMRARMMNGYWISTPYVGYRYENVKGHGKLLVRDEPVATIVQEALEGFASGRFETQSEVKRFLESHAAYPKGRNGKVHYQRVCDLLNRVIYAGYVDMPHWGIHLHPAKHEPLISFETYQAIQKRLKTQAKAPARKDIRDDFPLRGFINCGCCGNTMTSCLSKGRNGYYPYYLCYSKGCEQYGKSIRKEDIEGDFEELLITLRPSQELFLIAKEMFEELWEYRRSNSQNEVLTVQKELQDIERKVGQLLDRVVDASSQTLVSAYEGRIKDLEAQKISLSEKIKNCGRPLQSFDETFRTAFQFLGNPHKIWVSGGIEDKRIVLKLAFAEKLSYQRNGGFRTAATALPFRVLGDLQRGNKEMVGPEGLEPPTKPL